MSAADCDIAVVGGGVVGAAAALALHRAGFDTRLIEARPPPTAPGEDIDPRVYAISPGSAALFERLDAWQGAYVARRCAYREMRVWAADPHRALCFAAAEAGVDQLGWIVEQSVLLSALWRGLTEADLVVARAVTAAELPREDAPSATAALQFDDGSRLRARLVVAADGDDSLLRRAAGIDRDGRRYGQHALVCHVQTAQPHGASALQRFLPGGPVALLPLADGRRSLVWSAPDEEIQRLRGLDDDAFAEALGEATQFEAGFIGACTPRHAFGLRLAQAQRYAVPGLVLIGDAAHRVHPLAGQGANLGFGDVADLVAVLEAARQTGRRFSALRCLAAWERRRQAASREMTWVTDGLDRAFRSGRAPLDTLMDFGLSLVDRVAPVKNELMRRALTI